MTPIGVVGAGRCDDATRERAREVGRLLAEASASVICGGLGGVMEAASEGAHTAGGLVIGVLPGRSIADANPWVSAPVATGMGEARNAIIVNTAAGLIAVGGEYGTLSEIAFALKLGKPVVSLGSWAVDPSVTRASDPADAVRRILELVRSR